jgi:SAM-dependent methyltransferase
MDSIRKLHNNCKRDLITKWVKPSSYVLDCGCGRGGDLWKWKSAKVRLAAIDPDDESLDEAEKRSLDIGIDVCFLGRGDIRQAAFAGPFDVVCYNFSIHYIVDAWDLSIKALSLSVKTGGLLLGITPDKGRAIGIADENGDFTDPLGNEFHIFQGQRRMMVRLVDGPFYADGGREEPLLDPEDLIKALTINGFELLMWEPMLPAPNGYISDLYSKFVFRKIRE